jgi:energy-coupling factor transporter ATP-binding protein EcfA2
MLSLGKETAQHALVAGKTGSGKSTLLHVLITTLALNYSPDEIELYLIDFKKGVEFKRYATHRLPHARVIAIESEREFGLSVLEGIDAELKLRGDLFRQGGADNLKNYRQKTQQSMPRILLLVDEFQEFFTENDKLASDAAQILDRLVRQGRAFGIHILLGSQTLAGAYTLARSTIDQMAVRIALQCSEADSRLILSDDNPVARLLSRPGEAIYNAANGLIEGNNPFQVAWLPEEEQQDYLNQIKSLAQPPSQIVFEGNAPADVENNRALNALLANPAPSQKVGAWLGEPVAIKEATIAHFQRKTASNLLIVGQNDEAAMSILLISLLSLSAQQSSVKFYFLNFVSVEAPYAHLLTLLPDNVTVGRRRQLPDIINDISSELSNRLAHEDESLQDKPTIYLMIHGLQRARDLEPDNSFGGFGSAEESPSPAKQFAEILREGSDLGIHSLIWCDTVNNLNRRLDRQSLREFDMTIVFQMSGEDSVNLIDSPAASKIGQHYALFYNEEDGRLEKFRPFALPSEEWLKCFFQIEKGTR